MRDPQVGAVYRFGGSHRPLNAHQDAMCVVLARNVAFDGANEYVLIEFHGGDRSMARVDELTPVEEA